MRADAAIVHRTHAEEVPAPLDSGLDVIGSAPTPLPSYEKIEDSEVFLNDAAVTSEPPPSSTSGRAGSRAPAAPSSQRDSGTISKAAAKTAVTLFVYGWHNVEPGTLSWVFPNLRSALDAVQRMRNAIGWAIVSGDTFTDLAVARKADAVLVEQT